MNMEKYNAALEAWAGEAMRDVEAAREAGDERALAMAQMRRSMCEGMLPALGKLSPSSMQVRADELAHKAEELRTKGDFDSADRCLVQRDMILRAWSALNEGDDGE